MHGGVRDGEVLWDTRREALGSRDKLNSFHAVWDAEFLKKTKATFPKESQTQVLCNRDLAFLKFSLKEVTT